MHNIFDIVVTALIDKHKLETLYRYYVKNERISDIYYSMSNHIPSKYAVRGYVLRTRISKEGIEFLRKHINDLIQLDLIHTNEGRGRLRCKLCGKKLPQQSLYHHLRTKHKDYITEIINKLNNGWYK
jgi:hypothetical protein